MKRSIRTGIAAAVLLAGGAAQAAPKMGVSLNLAAMALGIFRGQFEYAPNQNMSIPVRLGLFSFSADSVFTEASTRLTGIGGGVRFYPSKGAIKGFFVGPNLDLEVVSITVKDKLYGVSATGNSTFFGPGAEIGYQWVFGKSSGFDLELAAGFNYYVGTLAVKAGLASQDFKYAGASPTFRLGVGYAF